MFLHNPFNKLVAVSCALAVLAGLLGAAAGSSLVTSEVFRVSVWDTSCVISVGNELTSPGLLTGVMSSILLGHQDSLWFSLDGSGSFCMSLHNEQVFPLDKISHLAMM